MTAWKSGEGRSITVTWHFTAQADMGRIAVRQLQPLD